MAVSEQYAAVRPKYKNCLLAVAVGLLAGLPYVVEALAPHWATRRSVPLGSSWPASGRDATTVYVVLSAGAAYLPLRLLLPKHPAHWHRIDYTVLPPHFQRVSVSFHSLRLLLRLDSVFSAAALPSPRQGSAYLITSLRMTPRSAKNTAAF